MDIRQQRYKAMHQPRSSSDGLGDVTERSNVSKDRFEAMTSLLKGLLNAVRLIWRNKSHGLSREQANSATELLQRVNEHLGDPYTRHSFLCCGVVPFLSPLLKLAALQPEESRSFMAQFQLSLLTTLSYIFIYSSGKLPNPIEMEAVKLLIDQQRLYEIALLCLYNTAYRDVRHLCASTLCFILDSREALPLVFHNSRREADGTSVCSIMFSSLSSEMRKSASDFQQTSLEDYCMAILGCIKLMVQKRELSVETIQSSAMAMSLLMEPSKHIPEMLLRNRRISALLHLVRDAVTQDSRSRHAILHSSLHAHSLDDSDGSSTGFSQEAYPSVDFNCYSQRDSHRAPLFSQPSLSIAPDHVSTHERRALYSFVSDMKASIIDDNLIDGYEFQMATRSGSDSLSSGALGEASQSGAFCKPGHSQPDVIWNPHSSTRENSFHGRSKALKWSHNAKASGLGTLNEACDAAGSASPPTMTRDMQQTRAPAEYSCAPSANPGQMIASRLLQPIASSSFAGSSGLQHLPSNTLFAQQSETGLVHQGGEQDCNGPFTDMCAPHTARQSSQLQCRQFMDGYPALLPGNIDGKGRRSRLSALRAGPELGLGDDLSAKPVGYFDHFSHVGQVLLNKDRLITSEVSDMRPFSALTQENVGMFQARDKICRPAHAAESCRTSSSCSSPSMVLNAAVNAFCAPHGQASEHPPVDTVLEVSNLPARLSAANLQGDMISERNTSTSSGIAAEQKGLSVDTAAPSTPAQMQTMLPPSGAIPGCKSSEPAALSLAPELSVDSTCCLPAHQQPTVLPEQPLARQSNPSSVETSTVASTDVEITDQGAFDSCDKHLQQNLESPLLISSEVNKIQHANDSSKYILPERHLEHAHSDSTNSNVSATSDNTQDNGFLLCKGDGSNVNSQLHSMAHLGAKCWGPASAAHSSPTAISGSGYETQHVVPWTGTSSSVQRLAGLRFCSPSSAQAQGLEGFCFEDERKYAGVDGTGMWPELHSRTDDFQRSSFKLSDGNVIAQRQRSKTWDTVSYVHDQVRPYSSFDHSTAGMNSACPVADEDIGTNTGSPAMFQRPDSPKMWRSAITRDNISHQGWEHRSQEASMPTVTSCVSNSDVGAMEPSATPFLQSQWHDVGTSHIEAIPQVKSSDLLQDSALRTILRESGIYDSWTEEKPLSLPQSDLDKPDAMLHLPAFYTSAPEHPASDKTQSNAAIAYWKWPPLVSDTSSAGTEADGGSVSTQCEQQQRSKSMPALSPCVNAARFAQEFPKLGETRTTDVVKMPHPTTFADQARIMNTPSGGYQSYSDTQSKQNGGIHAEYMIDMHSSCPRDTAPPAADPLPQRPHSHHSLPSDRIQYDQLHTCFGHKANTLRRGQSSYCSADMQAARGPHQSSNLLNGSKHSEVIRSYTSNGMQPDYRFGYSSGESFPLQLTKAGTSAPAIHATAVAKPYSQSSGVAHAHGGINAAVAAPNRSFTTHSNVWTEQGQKGAKEAHFGADSQEPMVLVPLSAIKHSRSRA